MAETCMELEDSYSINKIDNQLLIIEQLTLTIQIKHEPNKLVSAIIKLKMFSNFCTALSYF